MSTRTTVTFGGQDLTADYVVSDLRRPLLPREVGVVEVPGMDGETFTGARMTGRTVTMALTAMGSGVAAREAAARRLAAILAVDEPQPLAVSVDGGLALMCVPASGSDSQRFVNAETFEVAFQSVEPAYRGASRTATVPSGGTLTLQVGGTYPTMPTVRATAAAPSGGYWGLTVDGTQVMRAQLASGSHSVVADCERRTLTVDGVTALLPPASDWLELAPGSHSIAMTGTGAATVQFEERWL